MKRHELLMQKRPVAKVQRLDQLPAISIPCGRTSARVGTRDQTTSLIRLQNPSELDPLLTFLLRGPSGLLRRSDSDKVALGINVAQPSLSHCAL